MRSMMTFLGSALVLGTLSAGPAAAQDAAAGEKLFLQCRTCHQIGETAKNAVGPQLNGLFEDRKAGTAEGYSYSAAYKGLDKVWSVENFTVYIQDPRGVTPGTKMVYAGLKDEAKIKDLVAFLQQYGKDGKKK
jgi:cytochrome c